MGIDPQSCILCIRQDVRTSRAAPSSIQEFDDLGGHSALGGVGVAGRGAVLMIEVEKRVHRTSIRLLLLHTVSFACPFKFI